MRTTEGDRHVDSTAWRDLFTGAVEMAVERVDFTDLRYEKLNAALRPGKTRLRLVNSPS